MPQLLFKIMSPAGKGFHAVNYNEKKQRQGSAQLIYFKNFGELQGRAGIKKEEFIQFLDRQSSLNSRIKNPSFHAVISCAGKELAHKELQEYGLAIMEKLGYKNQPVLMYAHKDTDNNHVHIVSTRVDAKGRKINDSYERKRANNALNAIMNRHPGLEFEAAKEQFKNYRFSTMPQYNLLMESLGYKPKESKTDFQYIKYGATQGCIDKSTIEAMIERNKSIPKDENRIRQINAVIRKYAELYDVALTQALIGNNETAYADKKSNFKSDLTEMLRKNFGLDFLFFAAKDKATPYGYAVIDHSRQTIYKGSEIMPLSELTGQQVIQADEIQKSTAATDFYQHFDPVQSLGNTKSHISNEHQIFEPYDKETVYTNLINAIMGRNMSRSNSYSKGEEFKPKKKRKPKFH